MQRTLIVMAVAMIGPFSLCLRAAEAERKSEIAESPYSFLQKTTVKLPSANELYRRLRPIELDYCFRDKQLLAYDLAREELLAIKAMVIVDLSLHAHALYEDNIVAIAAVRARRCAILKAIFADYKDVVDAVQKWLGPSHEEFVELPATEELDERLHKQGLGCFVKETEITTILGGKRLSSVEIALKIDRALYDCQGKLREGFQHDPVRVQRMELLQPLLRETILSDRNVIQRLEGHLENVRRSF